MGHSGLNGRARSRKWVTLDPGRVEGRQKDREFDSISLSFR